MGFLNKQKQELGMETTNTTVEIVEQPVNVEALLIENKRLKEIIRSYDDMEILCLNFELANKEAVENFKKVLRMVVEKKLADFKVIEVHQYTKKKYESSFMRPLTEDEKFMKNADDVWEEMNRELPSYKG